MDDDPSLSDPSDWLSTRLAILEPIDSALRCQICKDFYNTPLITDCSHTFCSLCIRRCIHAEQICPVCRAPCQEHRLRKNNSTQELVDAFLTARPRLVEITKELDVPAAVAECNSLENEPETVGPAQRTSRRSTRRGGGAAQKVTARAVQAMSNSDNNFVPNDGLVACPICKRRMKELEVSSHLDKCLMNQSTTAVSPPSQSSGRLLRSGSASQHFTPSHPPLPPTQELKPLPKISYSLLKEKSLRQKLEQLGIPSHGTKLLLQQRHTEWMNMWNANVDSSRPRSKRELLVDLDSWERANSRPSNKPTKTTEWNDKQWAYRYNDDFAQLTVNARKKRKIGCSSTNEQQEGEDSSLPACVAVETLPSHEKMYHLRSSSSGPSIPILDMTTTNPMTLPPMNNTSPKYNNTTNHPHEMVQIPGLETLDMHRSRSRSVESTHSHHSQQHHSPLLTPQQHGIRLPELSVEFSAVAAGGGGGRTQDLHLISPNFNNADRWNGQHLPLSRYSASHSPSSQHQQHLTLPRLEQDGSSSGNGGGGSSGGGVGGEATATMELDGFPRVVGVDTGGVKRKFDGNFEFGGDVARGGCGGR